LAKIPELVEAGVSVALGTDAASSGNFNDMVRAMYLAAGIHKDVRKRADIMPPETVLEMATLHGARALQWEKEIGSIEVGKKADLAIFNTQRPEWLPLLNPVSNLVYSASGDSCETVIIDGKVVMEDKKILTFDLEKLLAMATSMAQSIIERARLDAKPKWPIT
jgi:5-methylthioadenosine/S-adenosylhomocysteine deaminase